MSKDQIVSFFNSPSIKIVRGAAGCVGAVTNGMGMGLVGGFLRKHHMMNAARMLARVQMREASRTFNEGVAEWKWQRARNK